MSPFSLPADLGSPGVARRWLADECAGQDVSDEACYSAQLATSELVTNAVIHARSAVTLVLLLTAGALRVEVSDDDPTRPQSRDASAAATSGRGMQIVGSVADRWGVTGHSDGKTVWFEVTR